MSPRSSVACLHQHTPSALSSYILSPEPAQERHVQADQIPGNPPPLGTPQRQHSKTQRIKAHPKANPKNTGRLRSAKRLQLQCATCSVRVATHKWLSGSVQTALRKLLCASCSARVALFTLPCATCSRRSVHFALRKFICASCFAAMLTSFPTRTWLAYELPASSFAGAYRQHHQYAHKLHSTHYINTHITFHHIASPHTTSQYAHASTYNTLLYNASAHFTTHHHCTQGIPKYVVPPVNSHLDAARHTRRLPETDFTSQLSAIAAPTHTADLALKARERSRQRNGAIFHAMHPFSGESMAETVA